MRLDYAFIRIFGRGGGLSNELRLNRKICFLLARGFLYYAEIKFCNQLCVQNLIQMKKNITGGWGRLVRSSGNKANSAFN